MTPHHAERLRQHTVARPGEPQEIHRAALRTHPATQMPERVLDAIEHRHHLAEQSLVARSVAVIRADRLDQRFAVLEQEALQRAQVRDPFPVARHGNTRARLTLRVERSLQQQITRIAHQKCTPSSTP